MTSVSERKLKILFAAGGTGGHFFPAAAVADELKKLAGGNFKGIFIGSPDKIEGSASKKLGWDFVELKMSGVGSLMSLKNITLPFKAIAWIAKCRKIIQSEQIDAVVASGAYLSFAPGIAASQKRRPLFLLESNVAPGKSIKALAGVAEAIFTSFEATENYLPPSALGKIVCAGNPVRSDLLELPDKNKAIERFGLPPGKTTIFAFGGSLGARSVNFAIEKALPKIDGADFQLIWQTGKEFDAPPDLPENVRASRFIYDMNNAYAAADFVIARAGATTIAELTAIGKPSLLVPYPYAANDHQRKNALHLVEQGAALMVEDSEIGEKLPEILFDVAANLGKYESFGETAAKLGKPKAASICAGEIYKLLHGGAL